jgi:DNA-binding transcriptional ArsR family regulator
MLCQYGEMKSVASNLTVSPVLESLFGSRSAAWVLLFLQNYGEAHARRIASAFDVSHSAIQRQLRQFEDEGVLVSRMVGRSRIFTWNPRNPTVRNLREFLEAELGLLPDDVTRRYFRERQRPRRTGKAL